MVDKVESMEENLWEGRAASTAGGGTALTTTKALITIPRNSRWIGMTPRNFVGADVAQFMLNPYLSIVRTHDLLVSPALEYGNTQDYSDELQDGDATDVNIGDGATQFDTLANGDALYVGSPFPFRGVTVTVGTTVQDVASVLTIKYWSVTGDWVDTANSEGTKSVGDCLKQSGDETWTVSADWTKASLVATGATTLGQTFAIVPMYWTRWEVSAALTASCQLRAIQPLNRSTAYEELGEGQPYQQALNEKQFACVEALVNAGTGNLIVNTAVTSGEKFN